MSVQGDGANNNTSTISTVTLKDLIASTMQKQQADLLQQAAKNTEAIVQQAITAGNIRAAVDKELSSSGKYDNVSIKNNINETHFNFAKQVHNLWKKTETAVAEKLDPTLLIKKGKEICETHIKLIQLADREGWDVARAYQADNLASDPQDEKRIRKAIRETQAKREKAAKDRDAPKPSYKPSGSYYKSYDGQKSSDSHGSKKTCWRCGKLGHITYSCPLSSSRGNCSRSRDYRGNDRADM